MGGRARCDADGQADGQAARQQQRQAGREVAAERDAGDEQRRAAHDRRLRARGAPTRNPKPQTPNPKA